MELIIKLIIGAVGFGGMSWVAWGAASSHDTGLKMMAVLFGLVALFSGFLAIVKMIHYSKWATSLFWIVMLGTLTYTFPALGLSQLGWLGWGFIAFLSAWSLIVAAYRPDTNRPKRSAITEASPFDEEGHTDGFHYTGYPTNKALRRGLDD
ncbi:MAG: hypothetical protein ACRC3F_04095 [Billgrantia desiderata]